MCELCASGLLGYILDVCIVNLDVLSGNELLFDKVPFEFVDAGLEVFFYKLLALVLVVIEHHALEQSLWEFELTNLLLHVLAYVEQELIV